MDVAALHIRLLHSLLMLLAVKVQNSDAQNDIAFPRIDPKRLQFFQYEPVSVNCEEIDGPTEYRVMRKLKQSVHTNDFTWETSTRSHTIKTAYPTDSGEYWCEDKDGKRSNGVNITVTAGDVILNLPAAPLTEGGNVSLCCQKKETSNLRAQFYKNSFQIDSSDKAEMTIHSVSKSDEGLYKCRVSGGGESPESWLTVKAHPKELGHRWIQVSFLWMLMLLLVPGLICWYGKLTVNSNVTKTTINQWVDEEPEGAMLILPQERVFYSSVCYRSVKVERHQ
ncbi:low affinity immunoglobulin gamma Fc region receptor III-like isoform X2 [Channa argus]|uniref:low affinity immunoglobulin gamma Fc region receptor III-like isoform X2 n=1 Tax=Channa argus TaxID=215402 RepID=UPI00352297ED